MSNQLLPDGDGRLFLYRNNRDGTFSRVTENPVVNTLGDSWGVSWADTDRDGDLDLLVVNDSGQSDYLLRNNGKNDFTRIEAGSLTRDARDGLAGVWGDYNNDGLLDALVTGFGGGPDLLHRGLGRNSFTNATSLGSRRHRKLRPPCGWRFGLDGRRVRRFGWDSAGTGPGTTLRGCA